MKKIPEHIALQLQDDLEAARVARDAWERKYHALGKPRHQWRFMWPHATDDMAGATWRDQRPTAEDVAEWRADMLNVWVETRTVIEGPTKRDEAFDE